ncbi:cell division ATP-binding protein FtsE [Lutispora saccharofermentans]|uniref:Cell division ATP-binding protein FtsE n=1 Tax=Lutispora saccharofermentans TaxID=3024236 RepID=A0ABT1NJJ4_9FIRM|nr:cell division ATP-binding protein FtsE [Lutispora saccharofermentans]MCQ1531447.1 cell division ATP-binding protein FtsE [Lutispora saccharofermentans]
MIELVNVSKTFSDGHRALSNINIKIDNGEFVFLVGPSGAGKSTLIKLLLKETEADQGKILINDKDVTRLKRKEIPFLRRSIGVVFQDFRLLQEKTVYENVAFAMEVIEAPAKDIRRQVPIVLSLVGLSKKSNLYPSQLSGGEQQRVSLARAMVNGPSILIADEPTGNLDPDTSWEIMKSINEINRRGTTILMATHAKEIVNAMKKRVIAIEEGTIARDDMKGGYGI